MPVRDVLPPHKRWTLGSRSKHCHLQQQKTVRKAIRPTAAHNASIPAKEPPALLRGAPLTWQHPALSCPSCIRGGQCGPCCKLVHIGVAHMGQRTWTWAQRCDGAWTHAHLFVDVCKCLVINADTSILLHIRSASHSLWTWFGVYTWV